MTNGDQWAHNAMFAVKARKFTGLRVSIRLTDVIVLKQYSSVCVVFSHKRILFPGLYRMVLLTAYLLISFLLQLKQSSVKSTFRKKESKATCRILSPILTGTFEFHGQ